MASSLAVREDVSHVVFAPRERTRPVEARYGSLRSERLADLAELGTTDIETSLVANLSGELHALFDPVSDGVLPIYFGPLLGRLYLEGL